MAKLLKIFNLSDLSEEERKSLIPIITNFSHQFYLPGDKLVGTNVLTHKIITIDKQPIFTKQYRFSPIHRDEIRKQTEQLINSGIVQPSTSPYNSPLLIVPIKSVYTDDIVIYATSLEEHSRKLKSLLGRSKSAGLALQPEKFYFLKR